MRRLILYLGFIISQLMVWAQPALEKEYNLFRANDYLLRQQVEFINPGEPGESLLWDFSNLKVIDEKYKISYGEFLDSLLIARELRTLYKYALKGDTLVSTGIESNLLLMEYCHPEMQIIYPVRYNDKEENSYCGNGNYCKEFNLVHSGISTYHADAWGKMILPEGDTLHQVLRVKHTRKQIEDNYPYSPFESNIHFSTDTILLRLITDTLWTQTDTYRWYAEGYRYPVFESVEYFIYRHGIVELTAATSFYHSPFEQYYGLEDDPENREKREWLTMKEEIQKNYFKANRRNKDEKEPLIEKQQSINYTFQQNKHSGKIALNYHINIPTTVYVILFDTQGRKLTELSTGWKEEGSYAEEFSIKDYLKGEYLLMISTTEDTYTEKVIN